MEDKEIENLKKKMLVGQANLLLDLEGTPYQLLEGIMRYKGKPMIPRTLSTEIYLSLSQ